MDKHSRISGPSASRDQMFKGTKRIVLVSVLVMIVFSGKADAIRNGILAEPGEFDAVCMVGDYEGRTNCTGTLIGGNLVLTACHCVLFDGGFKPEENVTFLNVTPKNKSSNNRGDYKFTGKVLPNPRYEKTGFYDLALVKLDKNVSDILQIAPIYVARPYIFGEHPNLKYVGYGATGEICETKDNRNKYWAESSALVVSGPNITIEMHQTGYCHGDSGGPVIDDNMTIVGVLRKGPKEPLELTIGPDTIEWIAYITLEDYNWIQNETNIQYNYI